MQLSWANNSSVGVVLGSGAFRDAGDGNINLGASNHRFATVFAKTGSINTSDRNEKNTIADIDPEQAEKLIMGLKPSTFKFNDGTSGRTHWGIISQDIEELLPQIGMTDMDFAGFIKSPQNGGLLRRCFRDCHRRGNRRGKNCNPKRIENPRY